ncbi:hypothetical protein NDU88_008785, partial [Pleurodeles waltl]
MLLPALPLSGLEVLARLGLGSPGPRGLGSSLAHLYTYTSAGQALPCSSPLSCCQGGWWLFCGSVSA